MNRNDSFDYYMKEKEEKSAVALPEVECVKKEESEIFEDKTEEGDIAVQSFDVEEEISEYYEEDGDARRFNQDIRYDEIFDKNNPKTMGFSVVSFTLSILSVVFCWVSYLGAILGVGAVVFSFVSRKTMRYFDKMGISGLILGIFGIVFGITSSVLSSLVLL